MVEPRKLRIVMSNKKHKFTICHTEFEVDTKYVPVSPLGRGSYGVVCSFVNKETNEKVAIKKINNIFESNVEALKTLREITILRNVDHENVIALKDVMVTSTKSSFKEVYLVYELMDTDLQKIIYSPQPISNQHCKYFLFQLLRGLKYLHSANILHRDLKPENLLMNKNCDLKICDFGLSRTTKGEGEFNMTEYVVTRWYRAPELLLGCDNYGASIDVWSVGCIFAELLGRKPLFPGSDYLNQLQLIIDVLGSPCEVELSYLENKKAYNYVKSLPYSDGYPLEVLYPEADHLALDLLQKLLDFDPRRRITVTEALHHPYLFDLYECIKNEPAPKPLDLDIDSDIGEKKLREMIWGEMLCYRSQAPYSHKKSTH